MTFRLAALAMAAVGCMSTGVNAQAPLPGASASSLEATNPFDPQRRVWTDRMPPPPPPAPPPPPPAVTDQDMQLYGVVIVGPSKSATVRVGPRFSAVAPAGKAFATLREGQIVGEFTVAQIAPDQVVLQAPGGQQILRFTKKTDRVAASGSTVPAPIQTATAVAAPAAEASQATPLPATTSPAAVQPTPAQPQPTAATPTTEGTALAAPLNATPSEASGAVPGTASQSTVNPGTDLAAALAAARAAAGTPPANRTAPLFVPFSIKP